MKTDPRTRIICLLIFIACVFISDSFITLSFDFLVLAICFLIDSASFTIALKTLKRTALFIIISSILSAISNNSKAGIILFIRLCLVVCASSEIVQTTSIKQISDALERLLHSRDLAMIISIALRFIPVLFEEANRIKDAQSVRGAKFSGKNLISRAKAFIPLAVPMFQNAFRRAANLGQAMEARGYDIPCKKTKMNVLKYSAKDLLIYILFVAILVASVYIRRFGFVI